jgi:hypothetical protein
VVAARLAAWGEVFAGVGHGSRIAPSPPVMRQACSDFGVRFFLPLVSVLVLALGRVGFYGSIVARGAGGCWLGYAGVANI